MGKISYLLISIFVCYTSTFDIFEQNNQFHGFFEIIFDRVENLFEDSKFVETRLKIRKVNKTRVAVGYVYSRIKYGNDVTSEYRVLKKQGGEFRYLPYSVPPSPFCDFMARDKYLYPDFAKYSDYPEDIANNCPLPIGNYSIYGFHVNSSRFPIVAAQSGEYASELYFYYKNQLIAITRFYVFVNKI